MSDDVNKGGRPISAGAKDHRGCMLVFGGVFAIVGALVMHFFFFVPISQWVMAQSWDEVKCRITESYVGTHSGDDGPTYSINIHYEFEYNHQLYSGDRYNFTGGSSSGYDGKLAVVEEHPVGSIQTCFVNPSDPTESVITTKFQWSYLIGLFGGIFLAVGLFIMSGKPGAWSSGSKAETWRHLAQKQYGLPTDASDLLQNEAIVLKPTMSRWTKLILAVVFVLIWDGISGFLVYSAWTEEGFGMLDVFAIIFGGIGALIFFLIPYQILALFNPIPELTLIPGIIPLGGTAQLSWRFSGGTQRLDKLTITLEGEEEATYRQGTDTRTARSVFYSEEIATAEHALDMQSGTVHFTIPQTAMHSFDASNNKIKWTIKIKGNIHRWPDVGEEFPVVVRPLLLAELGGTQNAPSET